MRAWFWTSFAAASGPSLFFGLFQRIAFAHPRPQAKLKDPHRLGDGDPVAAHLLSERSRSEAGLCPPQKSRSFLPGMQAPRARSVPKLPEQQMNKDPAVIVDPGLMTFLAPLPWTLLFRSSRLLGFSVDLCVFRHRHDHIQPQGPSRCFLALHTMRLGSCVKILQGSLIMMNPSRSNLSLEPWHPILRLPKGGKTVPVDPLDQAHLANRTPCPWQRYHAYARPDHTAG